MHEVPPPIPEEGDKKGRQVFDRWHEVKREFPTTDLPPIQTGHWLIRRNRASPERTWVVVEGAVAWLTEAYKATPPFSRTDGKQAYVSLEEHQAQALERLPLGTDVLWVHYTQAKHLFSAAVVCCPNHFFPEIPCPLPPS
ncbi:hypothetical protein [Streptomyces sp. NPDC051561]|uniref:hypothetical protein n=1 Tax=Streptomyces sp. NPDC051561 TaxID=3365658 RepID=UPI0037AEAF2F